MESGTLHAVAVPQPSASGNITLAAPRLAGDRLSASGSPPEQPVAVVVAGAASGDAGALAAALLGAPADPIEAPAESYLVIRYGQRGQPAAYVPGCREAQPYGPVPSGAAPAVEPDAEPGAVALTRPPRRVELELPHALLRSFGLVTAPAVRRLGVAGARILADVAERGGAVVFVVAADRPLGIVELDVLAELATREIAVFFAVTPAAGPGSGTGTGRGPGTGTALGSGGGGGRGSGVGGLGEGGNVADDPVVAALDRHRAALAARVPSLVAAPWLAINPAAGEVACLRRTLIEWAGVEGLRRAGGSLAADGSAMDSPMAGEPAAGSGTPAAVIRVAADAAESDWPETLAGWLQGTKRQVRQRLITELANIHLRCVQEILFGAGRADLPAALDRELNALSLRATAECDAAVSVVAEQMLRRVVAGEPTDGVKHRLNTALRLGLADDPANPDFTRVLLVTRTGGVASIAGDEAVAALPAYHTDRTTVLPPIAIGLSGGCYLLWHQPAVRDAEAGDGSDGDGGDGGDGRVRSWLQRVVRAVEHELLDEMDRRFEAVHRSLAALITEGVDHGILLV
ncbi:MAG TPA: hypothetical protein VFR67_12315 [Pilimelia sp.]|nr:hypothetical protein [Pilimelia sp.]